jgi:hypothetical protein
VSDAQSEVAKVDYYVLGFAMANLRNDQPFMLAAVCQDQRALPFHLVEARTLMRSGMRPKRCRTGRIRPGPARTTVIVSR